MIETVTGFALTAAEYICTTQEVSITDGNTLIYAKPASYTFKVKCAHAFKPANKIRI